VAQYLTKLLDDFARLEAVVERPRTFMEIAGRAHDENTYSNILAFFLDPNEAHGLGTLLFDALARVGRVAVGERFDGQVSVSREVTTDKGKRLDILVETGTHVVLIENKIYAPIDNPFDEYAAYLDRISRGCKKHKFLLTLVPSSEGRRWDFTNVTHAELTDQIRRMLDRYVSGADARYLTLLTEFLDTLENLKRGTHMNKGFVEMLVKREAEVEHFLAGLEALKDEMRGKANELKELIHVGKHGGVVHGGIWQDDMGRYVGLPYDVHVSSNLVVLVETSIYPKGWEISISPREGSHSELKDLLRELGILAEFEEVDAEGNSLHRNSFDHKYDDNLDGIRRLLQGLLDMLATAKGR
jgi:hypothetical protein